MKLYEKLGEEITIDGNQNECSVPLGNRRYLTFDLSTDEVTDLFEKAKVQ